MMENPLLCFFQFLSCLLNMVSYAWLLFKSFQCFNGCFRASNGFSNGCLMLFFGRRQTALSSMCDVCDVCVGMMPYL